MERITYRRGQYCQILLSDGTRLFVQVRPMAIKVRRMLLGPLLPGWTVWEFRVPYIVRRVGPAFELGSTMLDSVLDLLVPCRNFHEVIARLDDLAAPSLRRLVDDYRARVDAALEAAEDAAIIRDYGKTLAQLPQLAPRSNDFWPERDAKFLKSFGVSLQTRV